MQSSRKNFKSISKFDPNSKKYIFGSFKGFKRAFSIAFWSLETERNIVRVENAEIWLKSFQLLNGSTHYKFPV